MLLNGDTTVEDERTFVAGLGSPKVRTLYEEVACFINLGYSIGCMAPTP